MKIKITKERLFKRKQITKKGCWKFTGAKKPDGYGVSWYNGKNIPTHRLAWIFSKGEIPNELHVCHKCDNTSCINPRHLFLGTREDNMQDMIKKGRSNYVGRRKRSNKTTKL